MWVRQCELDAGAAVLSPIPTRIASNEEYIPPPQSAEQQRFEALLGELSDTQARRHGLDRRSFLRTGCGMATAFVAFNQVFGDVYQVSAEEADDPRAFEEKWPKEDQPDRSRDIGRVPSWEI